MTKALVIFLSVIFLFGYFLGIIGGSYLRSKFNLDFSNPVEGEYRSDEYVFLKTYYLMEGSDNYYDAYQEAFRKSASGLTLNSDVFTWRLPTVFYLWKLVASSGNDIFALFVSMCFWSLVSIYLILKKYINGWVAVMASIFILPYFIDAIYYKTSFLFIEWWSWFFLIYGLAFFVYNKKFVAFLCLLISLTIRELIIVPIIIFLFYSLLIKSSRLYFLGLILLFCSYMFLHFHNISTMFQGNSLQLSNALGRLHFIKKDDFLSMLSFSMRQYPLIGFKLHYFLPVFALFSFGRNLIFFYKSPLLYIHLAGISLLLLLPFITTSKYNDYWGITFVPTLIFSIALIFRPMSKNKSAQYES